MFSFLTPCYSGARYLGWFSQQVFSVLSAKNELVTSLCITVVTSGDTDNVRGQRIIWSHGLRACNLSWERMHSRVPGSVVVPAMPDGEA